MGQDLLVGEGVIVVLARILEEKGHLRHETEGNRYVYVPMVSAEKAKVSALRDAGKFAIAARADSLRTARAVEEEGNPPFLGTAT